MGSAKAKVPFSGTPEQEAQLLKVIVEKKGEKGVLSLHSRLLIRIAAEQNGVLLLVHIRYSDKTKPDKVLVVIVIGINKDSEELLKVDNRAVLRDNCLSHCSHLSL